MKGIVQVNSELSKQCTLMTNDRKKQIIKCAFKYEQEKRLQLRKKVGTANVIKLGYIKSK
jgi:hypothetical protein